MNIDNICSSWNYFNKYHVGLLALANKHVYVHINRIGTLQNKIAYLNNVHAKFINIPFRNDLSRADAQRFLTIVSPESYQGIHLTNRGLWLIVKNTCGMPK